MAGTEPLMTRTLDAGRRRVQWQESVRKTHDSTGFRAVRSSRLGSTEMHRHERGGMEMGGDSGVDSAGASGMDSKWALEWTLARIAGFPRVL